MTIREFDAKVIDFFEKISIPLFRVALFVIYFWFGILKVFDQSPASLLVQNLFEKTVPFMSFGTFFLLFGIFECLIGILFLIKGAERLAITLLFLHLITTTMPLFVLPHEMWSGFLIPTLEGQYVIKNLLIVAAAVVIGSKLNGQKN